MTGLCACSSGTRRLLTVVALVAALHGMASAQTFTGAIRGVVRDATGVVAGATVTASDDSRTGIRETVTNDVGQYHFPALPPATYSVVVRAAGYRTAEVAEVRLGTQQLLTVDVALEVGSLQEAVVVRTDGIVAGGSAASAGATLSREQLDVLPAPGRNAFLIGITVPTVNAAGDPQFNRQQDQTTTSRVSLGGGGVRANNYLLDGVPITDLRGRAIANPTIEAIEEVTVQVRTYDADVGRTGGGVFNVATRSGANQYHGSGFFQTRPVWGQSLNFFGAREGATKESTGLADSYYRLYGGGAGGPIVRERTFFWIATEGYRSSTTRGLQYTWPTERQRRGDFSRSTRGGVPVRLFNPWCRAGVVSPRCPASGTGSLATGGEFIGAVIPADHPALSRTGLNLLNAWPTETVSGRRIADNEDGNPNARDTARIVDEADMLTVKIDQRFSNRWSVSGFYLYNNTDEPGSGIMPADFRYIENQAEFFSTVRRRPHVLAVNSTTVLSDTSVLALRYGWQTWQDQGDTLSYAPGLRSLGFSSTYVDSISADGRAIFPLLLFEEFANVGGWGGDRTRWRGPYAINAAWSQLVNTHSVKIGADVRRLGVRATTESALGGTFAFNRRSTGRDGTGGHELASLLLGVPTQGSVPINRGEGEWFTNYYGTYVQDQWRVTPRLTLNYGVRFEHEDGLREVENRQTVGFDESAVSPLDAVVPKADTVLEGRTIRGGLLFAGVNGAPEHQGDPPAMTVAPRAGLAYTLGTNTVLRAGYGTFHAPWQYTATNHGQIGFARTTFLSQSSAESEVPLTVIDNPFPAGLQQPVGSSLGLMTGVGGDVNYIDQRKGVPVVHQYSVDVQRELPGRAGLTLAYLGATGRDLGFGGSNEIGININQIDPAVARRLFPSGDGGWDPAALRRSVDNPFFGIPQAGELGARATVPLGQLLRPFPQFGDVNVFERTKGGKRQYHAAVAMVEKRVGQDWWGGRYSYTWSRLKDNQFGEDNAFQSRTPIPQNVYDLDAEYSLSNSDIPHHIVLAPVLRVPDRSRRAPWLGGWIFSAIVELASGPPLSAVMSGGTSESNLGLLGGRQRPNVVGSPDTPGDDEARVSSADHPDARWFDATAFGNPGAGRYGGAPRTNGGSRYQFRKNVDLVVLKDFRLRSQHAVQLRFEVLNATNTPKFNGASAGDAVDLPTFGRITSQRGFMRIWQISLRYTM